MNKLRLVFAPRASERLAQIAAYLSEQGLPNSFVVEYLNQFEYCHIPQLVAFFFNCRTVELRDKKLKK